MNPIILFFFLLDAKCHIVVTGVAPDKKVKNHSPEDQVFGVRIDIAGNCNIFFVSGNKKFSVIAFIFDPSQGGGFFFVPILNLGASPLLEWWNHGVME